MTQTEGSKAVSLLHKWQDAMAEEQKVEGQKCAKREAKKIVSLCKQREQKKKVLQKYKNKPKNYLNNNRVWEREEVFLEKKEAVEIPDTLSKNIFLDNLNKFLEEWRCLSRKEGDLLIGDVHCSKSRSGKIFSCKIEGECAVESTAIKALNHALEYTGSGITIEMYSGVITCHVNQASGSGIAFIWAIGEVIAVHPRHKAL